MPGWQKYGSTMPPDFLHQKWEAWPDAGICLIHGEIIGLDLDTDDPDIAAAILGAIDVPDVRRRGQKGWMAYYRPTDDLSELPARVRWYREGDSVASPVVELLLAGCQSVLPPSIHPDTQKPYVWTGDEGLSDVCAADLPELTKAMVRKLDQALQDAGLTRQAPRQVNKAGYGGDGKNISVERAGHDLELPAGRSLNNRAMEHAAIDQWWPALDMPKSRRRGHGSWEAVPFWRASNSGRLVSERNPNLKAIPTGIVDFGADRSYTPIDVVMAARDCSVGAAMDWLKEFVRPEDGVTDQNVQTAQTVQKDTPAPSSTWLATPVFSGSRRFSAIKPIVEPTDSDWDAMVPKEPPVFPIQDMSVCEGLLGTVASHIDASSATATEAGGLAVALPLLGAIFGRAYATPTNLRSNVYTVALGGSGTGKTSLVNPAKELMVLGQCKDVMGGDRFASGSGVLKMLQQGPKRVCFLDEFGHMLQQIGSPGSGIHSKQIITEFTALYSAANAVFAGTAYADGRENVIEYPHLCLFGMATPDQFWRAFGSASLEDGSIARYIVFPLGETAPKATDDSSLNDVADGIREALRAMSGRKTGNMGNIAMTTAPLDAGAERARQALKEKESAFAVYAEKNAIRGGSAILRRVTENALKIALISAVGRNLDSPEIDSRDMEIGHALAWWSANVMISNIASHIADNQLERDVNDVERFISEAGNEGRSREQITRRFRRLRKRDLQETLEALEEQGAVRKEVIPNPMGGRSKNLFFAS